MKINKLVDEFESLWLVQELERLMASYDFEIEEEANFYNKSLKLNGEVSINTLKEMIETLRTRHSQIDDLINMIENIYDKYTLALEKIRYDEK